MKEVKVEINWCCKIERIPPIVDIYNRYSWNAYKPIILFDEQMCYNWNEKPCYSTFIHNLSINGYNSVSTLRYFVESAPEYFLKVGNHFTLYEGMTKVGEGVIIEYL